MERKGNMSDQQPAFTAYAVTKREGKDDWWTPIGAAFPHKDGSGYNIVGSVVGKFWDTAADDRGAPSLCGGPAGGTMRGSE